jgi:hypothetical protein
MDLLGLQFMIPIAVIQKAFTSAVALTANRFTLLFNYVPFTVADCANHFSLPMNSDFIAIKRGAVTDQGYTQFKDRWQEEFGLIKYECLCPA